MKLPFARLLGAVEATTDSLPQPVFVQHGHTPLASSRLTGVAFLNMDAFAEQIAAARLLIIHAGAGTIIHAIQAGKMPVVMPRRAGYGEHVDDHQFELASTFVRAGRVALAIEVCDLEKAVAAALAQHVEPLDTRDSIAASALRETLARYDGLRRR